MQKKLAQTSGVHNCSTLYLLILEILRNNQREEIKKLKISTKYLIGLAEEEGVKEPADYGLK